MNRGRRDRVFPGVFMWGSIFVWIVLFVAEVSAQTFDFDEGIKVLAEGLVSVRKEALRDKKIAVFGIIESESKKRWEISSHIEDGIVDVLVNEGYTVIERRRIEDIVKKELKKTVDFWFDETQVSQFGKLVGADVVVTGSYVRWGRGSLRINVRAISVTDGKVLAANKVKIHTDRIADLLRPVGDEGTRPSAPPEKKGVTSPEPRRQPETPGPGDRPRSPAPPTPQMGTFCCDQFGNRRCVLVQPFPLGAPCFCPGQGYGYTCQ